MKQFALVGAAGYIAPRHIQAIAATGNNLRVALDPFDSVGRLDASFPEAEFFTQSADFLAYCRQQQSSPMPITWTSICTPNFTHHDYISHAFSYGSHAICEKPLVLDPKEIDQIVAEERASGCRAYTILQLRLHEAIVALQKKVREAPLDKVFDVDLAYITSRGKWYHASWKGDVAKSGGIATNIGVHLYDMLLWLFGSLRRSVIHLKTEDSVAGYLELERARVRYFLSINEAYLPANAFEGEKRTYRALTVEDSLFEFSQGFTELHTQSYQKILAGEGFGVEVVRPCIELVTDIRNATPIGLIGDYHPLARKR